MRFINFQRRRKGAEPINPETLHASPVQKFCEHLAELDHIKDSLVERIGFVNSQIHFVKISDCFGFHSNPIMYRADGIGLVKDEYYFNYFEHRLNRTRLKHPTNVDIQQAEFPLPHEFMRARIAIAQLRRRVDRLQQKKKWNISPFDLNNDQFQTIFHFPFEIWYWS